MGMALDEPKDDDAVVEHNGIKFVMDTQTTDILRQSGGIITDTTAMAGVSDELDGAWRAPPALEIGAPVLDARHVAVHP